MPFVWSKRTRNDSYEVTTKLNHLRSIAIGQWRYFSISSKDLQLNLVKSCCISRIALLAKYLIVLKFSISRKSSNSPYQFAHFLNKIWFLGNFAFSKATYSSSSFRTRSCLWGFFEGISSRLTLSCHTSRSTPTSNILLDWSPKWFHPKSSL